MMRAVLIPALVILPTLVEARECRFDKAANDGKRSIVINEPLFLEDPITVEIDIPNGQLLTEWGKFLNEGYIGGRDGETMLFRGDEQTFFLTVARNGDARMSVHELTHEVVAYLYTGKCDDR